MMIGLNGYDDEYFGLQELRELKNFSSLRAILSGLQSHPVYRLRKCWSAVPK